MHRKLHNFSYQKYLLVLMNCIPGIRSLAQVIPLICLNFQAPLGTGLPKMRAGVIPVFRNWCWVSLLFLFLDGQEFLCNSTCGPTVYEACGTLGDVTSLSPCGPAVPGCNFGSHVLHGRGDLMLNDRKAEQNCCLNSKIEIGIINMKSEQAICLKGLLFFLLESLKYVQRKT